MVQTDGYYRCRACGVVVNSAEVEELGDDVYEQCTWGAKVCPQCALKFPPSLLKACWDCWDYAVLLRNGMWLRFRIAEIHGDYVTLHTNSPDKMASNFLNGKDEFGDGVANKLPYPAPRGIDVRVSDIVLCVDAPEGS